MEERETERQKESERERKERERERERVRDVIKRETEKMVEYILLLQRVHDNQL